MDLVGMMLVEEAVNTNINYQIYTSQQYAVIKYIITLIIFLSLMVANCFQNEILLL